MHVEQGDFGIIKMGFLNLNNNETHNIMLLIVYFNQHDHYACDNLTRRRQYKQTTCAQRCDN